MTTASDLAGALIPGVSPAVYGEADFRAVAEIVKRVSGIMLPPGKAMLVYSRLAPLVRKAGAGTFSAYVERVCQDEGEQARAVAALTTNHTFFYREAHHFEHFADEVRPQLVRRAEERRPVRLWSAGCSSGEETWSLVMTLLGPSRGEGVDLARKDVLVLASDLAPHAVNRASAATYAAKDLEPVPSALSECWTHDDRAGNVVIDDVARQMVRFRLLNLMHAWPMAGPFDVIFCRNVMIYFEPETNADLVARFGEMLAPGGHLYIGHSERVLGRATAMFEPVGTTIYRKRSS